MRGNLEIKGDEQAYRVRFPRALEEDLTEEMGRSPVKAKISSSNSMICNGLTQVDSGNRRGGGLTGCLYVWRRRCATE